MQMVVAVLLVVVGVVGDTEGGSRGLGMAPTI